MEHINTVKRPSWNKSVRLGILFYFCVRKIIEMKKGVIILSFVLIAIQAIGQIAKPLQFIEESFDFGEIAEKAGPVTHQFEFTNMTDRPVKILGVKPSCGCTTPDWTREPVAPGKTGFIQARFDPKGRPGYFTKHLTVTSDAEANSFALQIKGTVTREGKEAVTEFNGVSGNLLVKTSSFNFGKVFIKDEYVVREFPVMNNGKNPISYLNKYDGPKYIKISMEPKTLAAGEKGVIKLSYNGKLKNEYGFQSDQVVIHTDDEQQPDKAFSVFATLEDYFPPLAPADAAKAPKIHINALSVDYGRIKQSQSITKEVIISNNGKSTLQLKAIQSNCECINTVTANKTLKAGESTTIKIALNPQDRKGTQQKSVTIYSNDPQSPVQRITLAAYIED